MTAWSFAETCAIQSALILGIAWLLALAMARASAAARHLVWVLAFASIVLIPFLPLVRPQPKALVVSDRLFPRVSYLETQAKPKPFVADRTLAQTPSRQPWPTVLLAAWALGTLAFLFQIGSDLVGLRRIIRGAARFRGFGAAHFPRHTDRARSKTLLLTDVTNEIRVPVTWGIFRPVIVVPGWSRQWPDERFRTILIHELAHISRNDFSLYLLARIACALFWFNPLAWFGLARLRAEAEEAADDQVLASDTRAASYASDLYEIALALSSAAHPTPKAVGFAAAGKSDLEQRVRHILRPKTPRLRAGYGESTAICVALLLGIWLLPTVAPGETFIQIIAPRPAAKARATLEASRLAIPMPPPSTSNFAAPPSMSQPPQTPPLQFSGSTTPANETQAAEQITGAPFDSSAQEFEPVPASAEPSSPPGESLNPSSTSKLTTVRFENTDARSAFQEIFRQAGLSYTIQPDVNGVVSMDMSNVSFDIMLKNLCQSVGATYSVEGGVYMIRKAN